MPDIHKDLKAIKLVALKLAEQHNCNYNIIIMNPNTKGEFDEEYRSTYEIVADSYLQKDATNMTLLHKTDEFTKL